MLSYRHAYHAGNFADVLKHLVLIRILRYLKRKDTPLCYIDTHAAAGGYRLQQKAAQKTVEYQTGIGKLWEQTNLSEPLVNYIQLVRAFNQGDSLYLYPGSPWFAQQLLADQDRLWLYELHRRDVELLQGMFERDRRCRVTHGDGFQGAMGLLPPKQRRGLMLIDPPYEMKEDYQRVVELLIKAHKRFATSIYALWYPVVDRGRVDKLEKILSRSGIRNIQLFELALQPDSDGYGMTASGMIVINPPWVLMTETQQVLADLVRLLSESGQGGYRAEVLVAE